MKVEIFRNSAKAYTERLNEIKYGIMKDKTKQVATVVILQDMFDAFAQAMRLNGDEPVINNMHKGLEPTPEFRHALIFGYGQSIQNTGKSAVQDFRCNIIQKLQAKNGHTVCFDAGYFKTMGNYEYHRVGLQSPLNNGTFLHKKNNDSTRWDKIRQEYNIPWREWQPNNGDTVLIFLQPDAGYSMNYESTYNNLKKWVSSIKKLSNKKIAVRAHPKSHKQGKGTEDVWNFCQQNNIPIHTHDTPLYPILDITWRAITWNSTVAVEAIAYGVPTAVLDDKSMAWEIADQSIESVINPSLHPREQWIYDLHHTCWNAKEIATGELWAKFKEEMARRDQLNGITA